jgi:hypothetical protein
MTRLLILALFIPTLSFGQKINSTESSGVNNIYNNAVAHYLTHLLKDDKIKLKRIFIEKNEGYADSLQASIAGTALKILDWDEIDNKLAQEKSFELEKIFPLAFDNGEFYVTIIPFLMTKKANEVNRANGGGCRVIYAFDSQTKQFRFMRVHCWGI